MKIAVVHSFYRSDAPSGENLIVSWQIEALIRAGHDVRLVERRSDVTMTGPWNGVRAGFDVARSRGADPTDELRGFGPDVVHVHNLFPNFGTRWLATWQGPVVATLHNFRPLCAAATLWRDDALCTLCPDSGSWQAVRHKCYRGSRVASVPLAIRNRGGAERDAVLARADAVITLSARQRALYARTIGPAESWPLVPNFVPDGSFSLTPPPRPRWVCVGRLEGGKGVLELLDAWPAGVGLDVIGDGPLREKVAARCTEDVSYLGPLDNVTVRLRLPGYTGLVFPSRWPETGGLTATEAMAAGLPLVALEGNVVADDLQITGVGAVIPRPLTSHGLAVALTAASSDPESRGRSRAHYEKHLSEPAWVSALEQVYAAACQHRREAP